MQQAHEEVKKLFDLPERLLQRESKSIFAGTHASLHLQHVATSYHLYCLDLQSLQRLPCLLITYIMMTSQGIPNAALPGNGKGQVKSELQLHTDEVRLTTSQSPLCFLCRQLLPCTTWAQLTTGSWFIMQEKILILLRTGDTLECCTLPDLGNSSAVICFSAVVSACPLMCYAL